jgi:hypothetical protein
MDADEWHFDKKKEEPDSDADSVLSDVSEGSEVTVTTTTAINISVSTARVVTPESIESIAIAETPPDIRNVKRKPPEDCHVLIRWSELEKLVRENMICMQCGFTIQNLDRRTIGIATEIDFTCTGCKKTGCAYADRTDYIMEKSGATNDFVRRERRIDNYELNWRLMMATQLMGESQVGGSIIGLFLDITRESFRNAWGPMEDALGVEQRLICQEVVDSNLLKETMGKTAVTCEDGKLRYPVRVSYDMGWQKAAKTYDSLSGHGLMIGHCTNRVICFQNFSKACLKCELHHKKMKKLQTPDVPVKSHHCPKNYEGSSKGMEAQAALDCVMKIWGHEGVRAFIDVICLDDDATTKAYLAHCFADLDARGIPRPTNKKGIPKTSARDNKGQLLGVHPVISFLADLSHRVRTYAKYLYALKQVGKKESEMNDVDCLRLKRNFAWWIFSGIALTFENFRDSAMSPVLHHFNDHSQCGTWCRHRNKSQKELDVLKKYRSKETNKKLYLQCVEIIEKFTTEEHLRECHHNMSSQKNEAMNKSLMRYVPKDKTYCKTMSLTSRLSIAISIDTLGHSEYFLRLFGAMKFRKTELTFSGLRRMWRKKEYGRMRQGKKKYKLDRRLQMRKKMIEGVAKMENDRMAGRAYASGIRMAPGEEGDGVERPAKKRAKRNNNTQDNNKRTTSSGIEMAPPGVLEKNENENNENNKIENENERPATKRGNNTQDNNKRTTSATCKCGGRDHKRVSSKECPWRGLSKKEIAEKCVEIKIMKQSSHVENENCTQDPTTDPSLDLDKIVQSTSKFGWRRGANQLCDMRTHVTHPVHFSTARSTAGNPSTVEPLPSISDIAKVYQMAFEEDAIIIAQSEIACLDDLSLEGDVPDDISKT